MGWGCGMCVVCLWVGGVEVVCLWVGGVGVVWVGGWVGGLAQRAGMRGALIMPSPQVRIMAAIAAAAL